VSKEALRFQRGPLRPVGDHARRRTSTSRGAAALGLTG
jgi:hypothetical protein